MLTTWVWRSYNELSMQELYDILSIRQQVFLIEQKCFYNDLDYHDQQAMHLLGRYENKIVAYLRFFPVNTKDPHIQSFGRVLTTQAARGKGLGKRLIEEALRYSDQSHPVVISAQLYLEKFYQTYGFTTVGEAYDDANIPHIKMCFKKG